MSDLTWLKVHKIRFPLGSAQDTTYSGTQTLLAVLKRPTSKGREDKKRGEGKGREMRRGRDETRRQERRGEEGEVCPNRESGYTRG